MSLLLAQACTWALAVQSPVPSSCSQMRFAGYFIILLGRDASLLTLWHGSSPVSQYTINFCIIGAKSGCSLNNLPIVGASLTQLRMNCLYMTRLSPWRSKILRLSHNQDNWLCERQIDRMGRMEYSLQLLTNRKVYCKTMKLEAALSKTTTTHLISYLYKSWEPMHSCRMSPSKECPLLHLLQWAWSFPCNPSSSAKRGGSPVDGGTPKGWTSTSTTTHWILLWVFFKENMPTELLEEPKEVLALDIHLFSLVTQQKLQSFNFSLNLSLCIVDSRVFWFHHNNNWKTVTSIQMIQLTISWLCFNLNLF